MKETLESRVARKVTFLGGDLRGETQWFEDPGYIACPGSLIFGWKVRHTYKDHVEISAHGYRLIEGMNEAICIDWYHCDAHGNDVPRGVHTVFCCVPLILDRWVFTSCYPGNRMTRFPSNKGDMSHPDDFRHHFLPWSHRSNTTWVKWKKATQNQKGERHVPFADRNVGMAEELGMAYGGIGGSRS